MARWVGAQDQVNLAKKAKTSPIMTSSQKSPNPDQKKFFGRILKGLNISLALSPGDLWLK